ncbi:MAG: hypothetical protein IT314_08070 [Anaerolineales bacterium]|nr:hypothetical protein [Anaerolineales bacterium]
MEVNPIQTEADYEAALREVERLLHADSDDFALNDLSARIEMYEDEHYSIPSPSFMERISYFLESRGYFK